MLADNRTLVSQRRVCVRQQLRQEETYQPGDVTIKLSVGSEKTGRRGRHG